MNGKSDLRVMVMEVVAIVPKFLHIYSNTDTRILLPFSPYASLLMTTIWNFSWRKKLSLDVTVFFFVYSDKLVCSNSYSNQEAIG